MITTELFIAVIAAAGFIMGLRRGIIMSLGGVAAIAIAALVCHLIGPESNFLANALIFILVYIAVRFLSRMIKALSRMLMMGPLDRIAGGLFGAFEGLTAISIMLNIWWEISGTDHSQINTFTSAVGGIAPWLMGCISTLAQAKTF